MAQPQQSQQQTWTDEEWAEWRRSQQDNGQGSSNDHQKRDAADETKATGKDLLPLPDSWKLTLKTERNAQHARNDFSTVMRLCNRQLQRMHHQWQTELQEHKKQDGVINKLSIMTQAQNQREIDRLKEIELEFTIQKTNHEHAMTAEKKKHQEMLYTALAEEKKKTQETMDKLEDTHEANFEKAAKKSKEMEAMYEAKLEEAAKKSKEMEAMYEAKLEEAAKKTKEMEAMYEAKLKEAETKTLTMEAMGEAKLEALKAECHSKMRKTKQDYKQKISHKLRERNTTYRKKMENMSAAHNSYKGKVMKSVELWRRALSTRDDKILQLQLQLNLRKARHLL